MNMKVIVQIVHNMSVSTIEKRGPLGSIAIPPFFSPRIFETRLGYFCGDFRFHHLSR